MPEGNLPQMPEELIAVQEALNEFNEDERFYRTRYQLKDDPSALQAFLDTIDPAEAIRRELIIPERFADRIPQEMDDSLYFPTDQDRNIRITRHNRYTPSFRHRHDFFEIVYVLSGRCHQEIGLERKDFSAGDLIFIAPGIFHTMEVFDDESIIINILLRKNTFDRMFGSLTQGKTLINEFFSGGMYESEYVRYLVFHKARRNMAEAQKEILAMCREQLEGDEFSDQIMVGQFTLFIARIMRHDQDIMESSVSFSSGKGIDDLQIMHYVEERIRDVTLNDAAAHFGFSLSYCSRLIRCSTGYSFNEWKRVIRLRRARQMLESTNVPVSEIAYELGYENPESLIRTFKKEMGLTPAKYRRTKREGNEEKPFQEYTDHRNNAEEHVRHNGS